MRDVTSNVFDPIQPHLDQAVFNGLDLRHTVEKFTSRLYFKALDKHLGVTGMEWADLYMTGSLTTYQYSKTSDADHSVFPDYERIYKHLNIDPDTCRKALIAMSIEQLDGTFLPGTMHPVQFFVMPYGTLPTDVFKPGLRAAWSIFDHDWLVKPDKSHVHNIQEEYPDVYVKASAIAEKMSTMLDEGNIDAAKELWYNVHKKRQLDQRAGLGDFSEGNIVLKWLLHEGLIDRLRNEAGLVIQTKLATLYHPLDTSRYQQGDAFMYLAATGQIFVRSSHPQCIRAFEAQGSFADEWSAVPKPTDISYRQRHDELLAARPVFGWLWQERVNPHQQKVEFQSDMYGEVQGSEEEMDEALEALKQKYPGVTFTEAQADDYRELNYEWAIKNPARQSALPQLWNDRVTTKVIYDFDKDRIVLGTQATLPNLGDSKIVGEYVDGKVTLYEADKQWINPTYFRRLWAFSYPHRELKDIYFRRQTGEDYKLRSLPRKRKQDAAV